MQSKRLFRINTNNENQNLQNTLKKKKFVFVNQSTDVL